MKNPLTPAGIEPVTYRFVTQHSTPFPEVENTFLNIMYVTCRLKIVVHSIIRYEIAVIKPTLDIYMNT